MNTLPYLLTLLITVLGVLLNYLIKNLAETPIVEYKTETISSVAEKNVWQSDVKFEVTNISNTSKFDSLTLTFAFESSLSTSSKLYDIEVVPVHPCYPNSFALHKSDDSSIVTLDIVKFQPGFRYLVTFKTKTTASNREIPYLYANSNNALKIQESNIWTWCVKNAFCLNGGLVVFLILLILFYVIKITN